MNVANDTYDVFISYSRTDTRHAAEIDSILRTKGLKPFFDRRNLAPGLPWVRALEQAIGAAKATIVLIGPRGLGNTQQYERELALVRQTHDPAFPVVPVILPETSTDRPFDFLQLLTWVDFSHVAKVSDAPDELEHLLTAIRGGSISADLVRGAICPYRGLDAFREEDSAFFFGRGSADDPKTRIGELVRKVREYPFAMVVGRSGSGKSSLIYAGLLPALRRDRDLFWNVLSLRPGPNPLRALAAAFNPRADAEGTAEYATKITKEADQLRTGDPELLSHMIREELDRAEGKPDRLLLYIDQWEELYAQAPSSSDTERAAQHSTDVNRFIDLLLNAARTTPVAVVGTVRADFYDPLIGHQEIRALLPTRQVLLGSMSRAELESTIVEPAKKVGLAFDPPGLVQRIVDEVGEDERTLPLLQYALKESWALRKGNAITADSYDRSGGVREAIRITAERTFNALSAEDQQAARQLFLRLITPGEGQEDTRARAAMPSDPIQRRIVEQFAGPRTRLLVTGADRAARPTVEVAHEALIRTWPRLRGWIDVNREKLRARAAVLQAKAEWEQQRRREDLLLPAGFQLERARTLLAEPGDLTVDDIQEFIALSSAREQRRTRRRRSMIGGLVATVLLILTGVLIVVAVAAKQAKEAAKQAEDAAKQARDKRDQLLVLQSRFLTELANQRLQERDAGTAMLLALQALPDLRNGIDRPLVHEAEATLFDTYQQLQERIVLGHKGSVWSASIAPDGRRVVTASEDNTARVWNAENGDQLATFQGHTGPVRAAAFSPNSRQLITVSTDKTARVWDVETGKQFAVLDHDGVVRTGAFSPDGKRIVTASDDKTARVWDAQTGRQMDVLRGHAAPVRVAVFSPNGRFVLTTSEDGTASLWDAETGKLAHILEGHKGPVRSAAFSPDGERAITTSLDHSARVWDVATGKQFAVLEHDGVVWSAVFNPDGRRIVTTSDDKTARVWDAQTGRQIAVLIGHTESVRSAVFSDDGRSIVTASDDSSARVWNAENGKLAIVLIGHLSEVKSAVFSPDGRHVLTASGDTTARFWSIKTETSTPRTILTGGSGPVRSAVFSPDGRHILTASDNNSVRLWDVETGQQIAIFSTRGAQFGTAAFSPNGRLVAMPDNNNVIIREADAANSEYRDLQGHSAAVLSTAFSLNGRHIVTASDDKTARVWDVETGRQIAVLTGHTAAVRSAVFSPDGMRVVSTQMARRGDTVTSDDSAALLWDALSGEVIRALKGHMAQVYNATFSPDGKRIVTASADNTARIWDVATGNLIKVLKGHSDSVLGAAFSPQGDRIATASADKTARVWNVEVGTTIAVLKGHSGPVSSVAFGPDGERILTASDDGTARIWLGFPSTQALVDQSKVRVPRCLTLEQRENAFLDPEPPAWCFDLKKWPYQTVD